MMKIRSVRRQTRVESVASIGIGQEIHHVLTMIVRLKFGRNKRLVAGIASNAPKVPACRQFDSSP